MILTAKPVGKYEPGTPEWVTARKTSLGGSEIAAVIGLSPWQSYFGLWHQKMGLVTGNADNANTEWGRRLESAVADKWLEDHDDFLPVRGSAGVTFENHDRPWQTASPDVLLVDAEGKYAVLEVKTSAYGDGFGKTGTDEVPVYYRTQVLWYADTLNVDRLYFAVLIGGHDYREYQITVDDSVREEMAILRAAGHEFMDSVFENRRPDIDRHSATYQIMRALHPDIERGSQVIPDELAAAYRASVAATKEAKLQKDYLSAQILDHLGPYRDAVDSDGVRVAFRKASNFDAVPFLCPDYRTVKDAQTRVAA